MTLLYNCNLWSCGAASSGFIRHVLILFLSLICPCLLTRHEQLIVVYLILFLTFLFLVLQVVLKIIEVLTQKGYLKEGGKCYKIGYLGVLLCAIPPYLVFAKYGVASEKAAYGFYTYFFKSFFLYLSFMLPNTKNLVLGVEREHEQIAEYIRSIVQWILVIFLSSVWYFKIWFSLSPWVCLQIMFTAVQIIVLSDFWIVWLVEWNKRRVELDKNAEMTEEEEHDCFEQETSVLRYNKLKCSVCKSFYHESIEKRTPKMLVCGHTICQKCTKPRGKNLYIVCPICEKHTDIDELKKNYALLGIIQEMKQDKKMVQRRHSLS